MNVTSLHKTKCSGCGLCANVCAKQCIELKPDELGYLVPTVDAAKCTECGLCVKSCVIENPSDLKMPLETFGAVRSDKDSVALSSSGGVFAAVAEKVISEGNWYVVGSTLDSSVSAVHTLVDSHKSLKPLYGSKYVQSEMGGVYKEVKAKLAEGKKVLFSGTPCQVAAITRYTRSHPNLFTIEVICHGVANNEMFNSYLDMYGRNNIQIFYFRDKGQGWSFNNKIVYKNGKEKKLNHRMSSYMTYFLKGETYRDSCYQCPYARAERGADITIGDFWGILQTRPDLNEKIDIEKGVSCLLVNTEKGSEIVRSAALDLYEVEYGAIRKENGPLNEPSHHSSKREAILAEWSKRKDWKDVHAYWKKNDRKLTFVLWSLVPISWQHKIRVMLGKR